jgi:STE24 endopeptidase
VLAVGVVFLWPTEVPGDLTLSGDGDVFPDDLVRRAERFERFYHVLWVLSQIVLLGTLWMYARKGAAFARESQAGPIGTGMLLGMLGLAIVWLVDLPFRIAGHWWARRYDLTDAGYLEWLLEDWVLLGAQFLSICLALLIVMGLARRLGERWWLPGAAVFVGIAALFTFIGPYLDYTTDPLRNVDLLAAAERYERELRLDDVPVYVQEVSRDTDVANAYAYGLGPTKRVVFWDTMLMPPFDEDEQRVVLGHELAHHSQDHLPEGIGWFAIFAIPGAFVLVLATRARGGMGEPAAIPLALLVAALFSLAAAPLQNIITRRMEAEADWMALEVTRDPDALEGLMVGLADTTLSDPDPPGWIHLMTGTHPALQDRVAMARAWAERNPAPATIVLRSDPRQCWTLPVGDKSKRGCGEAEFDIGVPRTMSLAIRARRQQRAELQLSLLLDGRRIRWGRSGTSMGLFDERGPANP